MKFLSPILCFVIILLSKNGFAQAPTIAPNPFVQSATIQFTMNTPDTTSLFISNIWGSTVKTFLHDTVLSPGQYSYTLYGDSMNAGSYFVVLLRNGQQTTARLVKATNATAITEIQNGSTWQLYPNPSKDRIVFDKMLIGSEIIISDISGREYAVIIDQNQIDISALSKGSYIIRFKYRGIITDKEFIKE